MITGASQADVALLMVPADGNFTTAIAKGNHKAGEIQGQTRQHARLINLLGVKQLVVGVNKMDSDTAGYKKERYEEIAAEMRLMLERVGWKKEFIAESVPILPISGWCGDNLIVKSTNMPWWTGVDVKNIEGKTIHVHTLLDALNDMACLPPRLTDAPMRMPVSSILKIKGVGDVITGRVEQGVIRNKDDVVFLPTHTTATPCAGNVFSMEMHHEKLESAKPGDNVGINVKGLNKDVMPRSGDVMVLKKDTTLKQTKSFVAAVQILEIPSEIKVGYTPIAYVRTGRSACKLVKINWKVGKETAGKKLEEPHALKSMEMAECVFEPIQPLVVDSFKNCEGLSRVALMEGNGVVMLGKVMSTEAKEGK
jgi:elongation factor 1-alpha